MPEPLLNELQSLHQDMLDMLTRLDTSLTRVTDAMEEIRGFRVCRKCHAVLPIVEFSIKTGSERRNTVCMACVAERTYNRRRGLQL